MKNHLLPHHLDDLRKSGLSDETIKNLGFYSTTAGEVRTILGFDAGSGLVIPYPGFDDSSPFLRVKPDVPLLIDGRPAKYLSARGAAVRAYIQPRRLIISTNKR
jgi:hypothetical protein